MYFVMVTYFLLTKRMILEQCQAAWGTAQSESAPADSGLLSKHLLRKPSPIGLRSWPRCYSTYAVQKKMFSPQR